jgi:putative endonuclease
VAELISCGFRLQAEDPALLLLFQSGAMTVDRQAFGKSGEDLAVSTLEARGYAILARRYRTRHGEIDIVARDGETLVFVEVKARATAEFGTAAEAVTERKQRKLASMASEYLTRNRVTDTACRFDVVAIDGVGDNEVLTVYPGAFEVA